jgi:hypothetical protein
MGGFVEMAQNNKVSYLCSALLLGVVLALGVTRAAQEPSAGPAHEVGVVEGTLWIAPAMNSFAVENVQRQFYSISPVPVALRKYAESDLKKVRSIRVLGEINRAEMMIKPDKVQLETEGWANLKSDDLANKIVCDDTICRNCKVKCGGTCSCKKWQK